MDGPDRVHDRPAKLWRGADLRLLLHPHLVLVALRLVRLCVGGRMYLYVCGRMLFACECARKRVGKRVCESARVCCVGGVCACVLCVLRMCCVCVCVCVNYVCVGVALTQPTVI